MLAMNVQILRHTEYKNTSTEPPQILLSDLRFYCPTSEFTVRPQNLQYDLRIYSTTSESTVRPQNLQYDLRIYSTTSEFTVRPQSFTVRPGFLEVQILVQPDPAEVYYHPSRLLSFNSVSHKLVQAGSNTPNPPGSSCQVVHLLSAPQLACRMAEGALKTSQVASCIWLG